MEQEFSNRKRPKLRNFKMIEQKLSNFKMELELELIFKSFLHLQQNTNIGNSMIHLNSKWVYSKTPTTIR